MNIDYRIDECERTGYPEPIHVLKRKYTCCVCGENIYPGDDYYDFDGDIVCDDCDLEYIKCFKKTVNDNEWM